MLTQDERTMQGTWSDEPESNPHQVMHAPEPTVRWYTRGIELIEETWVRYLALTGLALATALLYRFAGGFPPWAWRFLAQVLPQFSALLAAQGNSALLALCGLLLLSFSLFALWSITAYCWLMLLLACWRAYGRWRGDRLRQHDAQILAEAQAARLYERQIRQQEHVAMQEEQRYEREQWQQSSHLRAVASGVIRVGQVEQQARDTVSRADDDTEKTQPLLDNQDYEEDERAYGDEIEDMGDAGDVGVAEGFHEDEEDREIDVDTPSQPSEIGRRVITYAVSTGSDPGKLRKKAPNEDTTLAIQGTYQTPSGPQPAGLFVVADGMGGHADGREASRLAVQVLGDVLVPLLLNNAQNPQEPELFLETLKEGVHRANLAIFQRNREREHMMGTTLTAALIVGSTAHIVNAGDSRTYVYRVSGELEQVTRDHSSVARLVEAGAIEPDDIYTHPLRNQIYRCLGDHASLQIDSFSVTLNVGDTLLLCSDGLWEMVRDPDIALILNATHLQPALARDRLIQAALDGGGADNVSVVLVTMI